MDRALLQRAQRLRFGSRKKATGTFLGAFRSHWRGQGLEYAESRVYEPGDDIRHLDWKVAARKGKFHTKLFEEERRLSAVVAVDISGSMHFGSAARTKKEMAGTMAALIAFAGLAEGDSVEIVLFDEVVRHQFGPFRTKAAVWHFIHHWERQPERYRSEQAIATSFEALAKSLLARKRLPQLVVVLSDFDAEDMQCSAIQQLGSRLDILAAQILNQEEFAPIAPAHIAWTNPEQPFRLAGLHTTERNSRIVNRIAQHRVMSVLDDEDPILALSRLTRARPTA